MTVGEKKVARHRLSLLEPAKALGNVTEACRRRGIPRSRRNNARNTWRKSGDLARRVSVATEGTLAPNASADATTILPLRGSGDAGPR